MTDAEKHAEFVSTVLKRAEVFELSGLPKTIARWRALQSELDARGLTMDPTAERIMLAELAEHDD